MRRLGKAATMLGIMAILCATTFGAMQAADAHCHHHWRHEGWEHRNWMPNNYYNNSYYNRPYAYPAYNAYPNYYGNGYGYGGPGMMTRVFSRLF